MAKHGGCWQDVATMGETIDRCAPDQDAQHSEKVFVILYDVPEQKPAIDHYCFGMCQQILLGELHIPFGSGILRALACQEAQCPALDRQMEEPLGTLPETGEPVYLRKLREGELYG